MKTNELKLTGWLIVGHILVMLAAGVTLIFAFEFPDILRQPMETTLQLFIANKSFTVPAYYLFTLSGISFMSLVLLLYKTLNFQYSTSGFMAVVFGVLFGLTSSLGFVRWPFLMQELGEMLSADAQQAETIRIVYNAFHSYAGVSVGENFAFWFEFLWMFLFSRSLLGKPEVFPRYVSQIGQALGVGMLIYSMEQFGGAFAMLAPLNMFVHTAQLGWLLGIAFCLFNTNSNRQGVLSPAQRIAASGLFIALEIISLT